MPITKSAKRALRQSLRRKIRNLKIKQKLKDLIKEVRVLASRKEVEKAKSLIPQLYKAFDKAAKVGMIKKNTAARKKSRLTRLIAKSSQPPSSQRQSTAQAATPSPLGQGGN